MNPQELSEKSLLLLRTVLEKVPKTASVEEDFIKTKAAHILSLAHDALFLQDYNRTISEAILIRAMLETLFKLVAAVKSPKLALESIVEDLEAEAKRMKDSQIKLRAAELRKLSQLSSPRKLRMKFDEWADKAGLAKMYDFDYKYWSLFVHDSVFANIADVRGIDKNHRTKSIIFCVLKAAGGILHGVHVTNPRRVSGALDMLWNTFGRLEQEGVFMPQNHALSKTKSNAQESVRRVPRQQSN